MKHTKKLLALAILTPSIALFAGCSKTSGTSSEVGAPKTEDENIAYSFGVYIGKQIKTQNENLLVDHFTKGFKDGFTGENILINDEDVKKNLDKMVEKLQEEAIAKAKAIADKNTTEAKKFFEENAKKEGVVTDESGLQYKVVKAGEGKNPKVDDLVTVNYEGKLLNGEVFDSSYERGEPAKFKLNQVIKGWQLGLQKMNPGAEFELYIPSDLAYGEVGAGDKIGGNAALIFKVELISIGEEAKAAKKDAKK